MCLIRIEQDKYNKLVIKAKKIMDKIRKIEEQGESNNNITEWNRLRKETDELERQLIPQLWIQERQKKEELQQEKVEKLQRRKLKQERDNNVNLKPQDQ